MVKTVLMIAVVAVSVGFSYGLLVRSANYEQDQQAMLDFAGELIEN